MSAKRILLISVLCLGLIFGFFHGVSAQAGNVCIIQAYEGDQEFSNSDCSSYTINDGWIAVSPGLVKEFLKSTSIEASFTGGNVNLALTPQAAANLWGPIHTLESASKGVDCPTGLLYRSQLRWNLGQLAPGDYRLDFATTFNHPLNDGTISCVDDQGQHLPNIIYSETGENEIKITITP